MLEKKNDLPLTRVEAPLSRPIFSFRTCVKNYYYRTSAIMYCIRRFQTEASVVSTVFLFTSASDD